MEERLDFGAKSDGLSELNMSSADASDTVSSKFDTRFELLSILSRPPKFTETSVYNRKNEKLVVLPRSFFSFLDLWGKKEAVKFVVKSDDKSSSRKSALFSLFCNLKNLLPVSIDTESRDFLIVYLCFPLKLLIIAIALNSYVSFVFQDESIKNLIKLSEQNQLSSQAALGIFSPDESSHMIGPIIHRNVLSIRDVPLSVINLAVVGAKLTFVKCSREESDLMVKNQLKDKAVRNNNRTTDEMNKFNGTSIHVEGHGKVDHAMLIFTFHVSFQDVSQYVFRSYEDCAALYLHLKTDYKHAFKLPKLASQRKLFQRLDDTRRNRHLHGTLDLIHKDRGKMLTESKATLVEHDLLYWQHQQCEVISFLRRILAKEQLSDDLKLREFLGFPPALSYSTNSASRVLSKLRNSSEPELEVTLSRKNLEFHKEIYSTSQGDLGAKELFKPDFAPPAPEVNLLDTFSDTSSHFPLSNQQPSVNGSTANPDEANKNGCNTYKDIQWRGNTMDTIVFEDLSPECKTFFYDPSYPDKMNKFNNNKFNVRGKYYFSDKRKVDAGAPIGRLVLVETIEVEEEHANNPTNPIPPEYQALMPPGDAKKKKRKPDRYDHIASKGKCARRIHVLRTQLLDKPFVHVVNLQIPGDPPVSCVCYILIPRRFIDSGVDIGFNPVNSNSNSSNDINQPSSSSDAAEFTDDDLAAKKLLNSYFNLGTENDRLAAWGIETETEATSSLDNANSDVAIQAEIGSPDDPDNSHYFDLSPLTYSYSDEESGNDSEESCDSDTEKSTVGSISSKIFRWSSSKDLEDDNSKGKSKRTSKKAGTGKLVVSAPTDEKEKGMFSKLFSGSLFHSSDNAKDPDAGEGEGEVKKSLISRVFGKSKKKGLNSTKSESGLQKDVKDDGSDSDVQSEASAGSTRPSSVGSSSTRSLSAKGESQSVNVIDTKQHILQNSSNSSLFGINGNRNNNSNSNSNSNLAAQIGLPISPPYTRQGSNDSFESGHPEPSSPGRSSTNCAVPGTGAHPSSITSPTATENSANATARTSSSTSTNPPTTTTTATITPPPTTTTTTATTVAPKSTKEKKPKNFNPTGGLVSGDVTFASPWEPGGYPLDSDFRNKRFKLIPMIVDGPMAVKMAVGTKPSPVLLAKRVAQRYFAGPGYMETDVDIGSSGIAAGIVGLCRGYASAFVCHMAVLMESLDDDELPEKLIGTIALNKINVNQYRAKLYGEYDKEEDEKE